MKEKNMLKKIKYFASAVFSTDAKYPPPPPLNKFLRVKKYFPFARKKQPLRLKLNGIAQ